jgi:hypothetical protein
VLNVPQPLPSGLPEGGARGRRITDADLRVLARQDRGEPRLGLHLRQVALGWATALWPRATEPALQSPPVRQPHLSVEDRAAGALDHPDEACRPTRHRRPPSGPRSSADVLAVEPPVASARHGRKVAFPRSPIDPAGRHAEQPRDLRRRQEALGCAATCCQGCGQSRSRRRSKWTVCEPQAARVKFRPLARGMIAGRTRLSDAPTPENPPKDPGRSGGYPRSVGPSQRGSAIAGGGDPVAVGRGGSRVESSLSAGGHRGRGMAARRGGHAVHVQSGLRPVAAPPDRRRRRRPRPHVRRWWAVTEAAGEDLPVAASEHNALLQVGEAAA